MPVQHDPFAQIVNVHWGDGLQFLYSGADGMWASEDGQSWKKAEHSVPAVSLATVDEVWVGVGPDGVWRSVDDATTWAPITGVPALLEVVAMKPKDVGPDGGSKKGVFAGWMEDEEGENHIVYTSLDLGKTWLRALSISTTVGENGYEFIQGISGCDGTLFVCTSRGATASHNGDGLIYSSITGSAFKSQLVFGPGTDPGIGAFPRLGFYACAVAFDEKAKRYIAIGGKEYRPDAGGVHESFLIYATSATSSFGTSEGTIAASASQTTGAGDFISVATSAAGGNGKHIAGLYLFHNGVGGVFVSGELKAGSIPGLLASLQSMGGSAGGYIGSFCFKPDEVSTDGSGSDQGVFACTAFGADKSGGAYLTSGAAFTRTHSGKGIDIGGAPRGAVAVGTVGFL
jgi:hypothetical protein